MQEVDQLLKGSEGASYEVHMGFAEWHMMLAQIESMPAEKWRALAAGRTGDYPQIDEAVRLLRQATARFRTGARACMQRLASVSEIFQLERALLREDARVFNEIADRLDQMSAMLTKRQVPSVRDVHSIEHLLHEQHMAMERKTSAIGALKVLGLEP